MAIINTNDVRDLEIQRESGNIEINVYYDKLTDWVIQSVLKSTSVCIDVGCHEGSILRLMMKYAPQGKFLAFEPLPHLCDKLKQTFSGNNVQIFNLALSNTEGESTFNYVITNPQFSGLVKRRYDRDNEEDTQITVKTQRLDKILSDNNCPRLSFMKVDVEGAECLVFEGAQNRLRSDKPVIVFEHGMGACDCYGKRPEDVFDILVTKCGLRISLMADWLLGKPSMDQSAFCHQYYSGKNFYFIAHA